mgnify:FL=1
MEAEEEETAAVPMEMDGVSDREATVVAEVEQVSAVLDAVALADTATPVVTAATAAATEKGEVGATAAMLPIRGDGSSNQTNANANAMDLANHSVVVGNQSTISRYFSNRISPCPRINAAIIIRGHTLYVYGGITELGDTEITLDDCWCLDLNKRDKWKQLLFGTMHSLVWKDDNGGTSTLGDDDSDGSDDSDYDDDDEEEEEEEDDYVYGEDIEVDDSVSISTASIKAPSSSSSSSKATKLVIPSTTITASTALTGDTLTKTTHKSKDKSGSKTSKQSVSVRNEINALREQLGIDDEASTPSAGEALRAFYSRTMAHWSAAVIAKLQTESSDYIPSEKEVKREGFKLAEER